MSGDRWSRDSSYTATATRAAGSSSYHNSNQRLPELRCGQSGSCTESSKHLHINNLTRQSCTCCSVFWGNRCKIEAVVAALVAVVVALVIAVATVVAVVVASVLAGDIAFVIAVMAFQLWFVRFEDNRSCQQNYSKCFLLLLLLSLLSLLLLLLLLSLFLLLLLFFVFVTPLSLRKLPNVSWHSVNSIRLSHP